MTLPAMLVAALALASVGCGGDGSVGEDIPRFDARDAVIEESFDATVTDAPSRFDVIPSIDVTPIADARPGSDLGANDDGGAACQAVSEEYAAAVREAQTCVIEVECGARVCETLCCACEVFVHESVALTARLERLRAGWTALGCATMGRCAGGGGCGAALTASCSAEGRCVTVRDRLADGGALADAALDAAVALDAATR